MLFYAETYSKDRELCERLGLETFALGYGTEGSSDWRNLGTVVTDWATVDVAVSCLPAQFYRFTIVGAVEDVQSGVLTTGSGCLSDFWPVVEQWIGGMLHFDQ